MKYFKRLQIYKASNVIYDPATKQAWSYGWWRFVEVVGGQVVFNSYNYSTATRGHQRKVRDLLDKLGVKIDLYIQAPNGLQDLGAALEYYKYQIKRLNELIAKPKTHKAKNLERAKQIKDLEKTRQFIFNILKKRGDIC
jgi:hypothetical protein